jgi:hypothetical protein
MRASMPCSSAGCAFGQGLGALQRTCACLLACVLLFASAGAWAHKASDAYVQVDATDAGLTLRVDVALRDLDAVLDLDADGNGQLTWGEVRAAWPAIESYVAAHVQVDGCALGAPARSLERRADGVYAALAYASPCVPSGEPVIRYSVFADVDPTHRGIARLQVRGQPAVVRVLDPRQPAAVGSGGVVSIGAAGRVSAVGDGAVVGSSSAGPAAATATEEASAGFLREGVRHIVTGYDHVLFLMCLLFPAVMRRTGASWHPVKTWRAAVLPVLGIVTAFTVAHSITLALAALKWVALPSSFIEPAIAVTIMLAAFNNIWPIFGGRVLLVTFAFGLLHGFGFASVLSELNLPTVQFAGALLQFNVGLEMGQVLIVMGAMSLMFLARNSLKYVPLVIRGGSAAAMVVALLWFVERTADLKLLPF